MNLLEQMNRDLGIDKQYIRNCAKRNNLYARYYIKKKNGGRREILQPSKELKVLQYWLINNFFNQFPISPYSSAYQKGCSIRKNADCHKYGKYILHTDIVHFFESITSKSMNSFFLRNKDILGDMHLTFDETRLILNLVLYKGAYLVVGSVASPMISNCFMYEFDMKLGEIITKRNMKYTRYADDIVISSDNYIDNSILDEIDILLNEYGFKRNIDKTYFMCKRKKREVTGLVIDNNDNSLSIGHKKYNQLKRDIYNYLIKKQGNCNQIKGKLAHLKNVNIDKYIAIKKIYSKYDKSHEIF
ncbi:MAG: retron St85 family RNA-directed DNA polymerase [Clostridia bacterium]|nr:retron St85 family RNA-directed DNA polymerase [Clostridia bacterium]